MLRFIEAQGPNGALDDGQLTRKLAMLLALTTASRASEIQKLNLNYFVDLGDTLEFSIKALTKTRRVGEKPRTIVLHQFADNSALDVVQCVRDYIVRTREWRVSDAHHQLLLGTVKPHGPVVTCTVAHWLVRIMELAGVDVATYKAHSTRSAATSKAKVMGLSIAEIMQRANWKCAGTFRRFYDRSDSSQSDRFSASVLW